MFNGTAVAQTMLVPFSVNALSLVAIEPGREVGAAWEQSLIDRTGAYCDGMDNEQAFPVIRQTVLDTADSRGPAEFYRQLFGLRYRPGRRAARTRPAGSEGRAG
jgi:hypothetical protein